MRSSKQSTGFPKANLLASMVMLAGAAATLVLAMTVRDAERQLVETEFRQQASALANAVQGSIDRNIEVLEAIAAYYARSGFISRAEFHDFIHSLLPRHGDIQALEWIPRVTAERRAAYEALAQREGFPGFHFTERQSQGHSMVPAGDRPEYFPVYFVEPLKGNEAAVGYDLASNATRREALAASRSSGTMAATARITLVQEVGTQAGFLIFRPIFAKAAATAERGEFLGFALGVFRVGDMVAYALRNEVHDEVIISLHDLSASAAERLLYADTQTAGGNDTPYRAEFPLQMPGRSWLLHAEAAPPFMKTHHVRLAWGVLAGGLAITVLLAAYLRGLLIHDREQLSHVAALAESNRRLEDEIGERRRTEEALRNSEASLDAKVQERTRELLKAQDELVRKEKLAVLGTIAGSVGHELRNPLGVMNNAVYFLQTVLIDADATTREYLNMIRDEIMWSEHIVSDLLDAARTKPPQREPTRVQTLLAVVLRGFNVPDAISVRTDLPVSLPAVEVDPLQIQQVFHNLIANAIDAMPAGGTLEIIAAPVAEGKIVRIAVRDSGCGIKPEHLDKLFQPLFTTKARGLGLGLVVVKNLTEANGGHVEVESEPGRGTTFVVMLPAHG